VEAAWERYRGPAISDIPNRVLYVPPANQKEATPPVAETQTRLHHQRLRIDLVRKRGCVLFALVPRRRERWFSRVSRHTLAERGPAWWGQAASSVVFNLPA
jgi:hypothetical protein